MNVFTVSFFGHRLITNPFEVEKRLEKLITELIKSNEYVEFLVGREGDFDILVSTVIHKVIKNHDYGNSDMTLILPYMKAEYKNNKRNFLNYYDNVEICTQSANAHYKAAITIRNKAMIDRSNIVICCIEHKYGGAYNAVKYAINKGVPFINLYEK